MSLAECRRSESLAGGQGTSLSVPREQQVRTFIYGDGGDLCLTVEGGMANSTKGWAQASNCQETHTPPGNGAETSPAVARWMVCFGLGSVNKSMAWVEPAGS